MGEERRSCAAAGAPEEARGAQGQAAQVALQGGPGFPGAERNGAETQLRPTRKRDVGAPRRRAAQRNAAEQRGSPVGWAGSNLSRRSFRRSLRRRDGRRRKPCGRTERGRIPQSALEGNLRRRSPPGADGKQALRATVAGAAAGAEEGRSRSRLPGRKRQCARRSICPGTDAAGRLRSPRSTGRGRERTGRLTGARRDRAGVAICPGSGRRRLAVEPAERQLPAGVNGQVAWRRNQSEPAPVRAGGAE